VSTPTLDRSPTGFGGELITPDHSSYEDARAVWNGVIDAHPAAVAPCRDTRDVRAVVRLARTTGLPLAVRGGGHNVAGFGTIDDGIVLDLSPMRRVEVDPEGRTAVVGGGATWGDVDRATQVFGLATPGGVVSDTGVGGLTLSGGFGWLRRKHGLSCDNIVAAEVVTADGSVRHVDLEREPDLLWALRGGGGNFGVVTSFVFRLHPLGPDVWFTFTLYPLEAARTVLLGQDEFMRSAPDEISTTAVLGRVPPVEQFPARIHGAPFVAVLGMHAGSPAEGEVAAAPLRRIATPLADLSGTMRYVDAQRVYDADYPRGSRYYWKSAYVSGITAGLVDVLVEQARLAPSDHATVDVWFNGGAVSRVGERESAFARRDALYGVTAEANWEHASDDDAGVAWARGCLAACAPYASGGLYLNFAGFADEATAAARASYGTAYPRLEALKAKFDPENLFRHNQNVVPAC
jgi:FAD/FMN-containing dehydrogenase